MAGQKTERELRLHIQHLEDESSCLHRALMMRDEKIRELKNELRTLLKLLNGRENENRKQA